MVVSCLAAVGRIETVKMLPLLLLLQFSAEMRAPKIARFQVSIMYTISLLDEKDEEPSDPERDEDEPQETQKSDEEDEEPEFDDPEIQTLQGKLDEIEKHPEHSLDKLRALHRELVASHALNRQLLRKRMERVL